MRTLRYTIAIAAIMIAVTLTLGCSGSSGTTDQATPTPPPATGSPTAAVSASPTAAPTPTPAPTPVPKTTLTGNGNQATEKFHLDAGLAIFKNNNVDNGQYARNFMANLMNSDGNLITIVANEIGTSESSDVVNIPKSGDYLLDVTSGGSWTITAEQPKWTTAQAIPVTLSGSHSQATEPFYLKKGMVRFESSNVDNGQFARNFIVYLMDSNGNMDGLVANDIGTKDSSKAMTISKDGVYLLSVSSGGDWTISVKAA